MRSEGQLRLGAAGSQIQVVVNKSVFIILSHTFFVYIYYVVSWVRLYVMALDAV